MITNQAVQQSDNAAAGSNTGQKPEVQLKAPPSYATVTTPTYASVEAYEQARLEAVNTLRFSVEPLELAWRHERTEALDLIPFDGRIHLSEPLADRIKAAELAGVRVRP